MKRKIIGIYLIGIFLFLSSITASVFGYSLNEYENHDSSEAVVVNSISKNSDNPEVLDQYQNDTSEFPFMVGRFTPGNSTLNIKMAQSFIPQKEILTKIQLYISKNQSSSQPFNVAIRKELSDGNLFETGVLPGDVNDFDFSNSTGNLSWVDFTIENLFVDVGETYYIVCYTQNITDNFYLWGHNNISSSYLYGEAYISYDDGASWSNNSKTKANLAPKPLFKTANYDDGNKSDMCFRTYGIDATTLDIGFPLFSKNFFAIFDNLGDLNATSVFFDISIKGGFLNLINESQAGLFVVPIEANSCLTAEVNVFGLGPVNITVSAYASNAKLVTKTVKGFVILSYVIVLPF
jgi:hypothetical protein